MLISMVTVAVNIARKRTVDSFAKVSAELWSKAIMSEYDKHLLDDYGIMAFHGNESDIEKKLINYENFTFENKLRIKQGKLDVFLDEYRMSDLKNFRKSLNLSIKSNVTKKIIENKVRESRKSDELGENNDNLSFGHRTIKNNVVIDTLPSKGEKASIDIKNLVEKINPENYKNSFGDSITGKFIELQFLTVYMGSHIKKVGEKSLFANEYEYVIKGGLEDNKNFELCKRDIFIIRNALNMVSLGKDKEKMEAITAISEIISPGPTAVITQALIMETWAALEANEDLKSLLDNEKVPLIKNKNNWKISIRNVIKNELLMGRLSDDEKRNFNDNYEQINGISDTKSGISSKDGLSYEDYLMLMLLKTPRDLRTKRIMDLIQINMKYRYYDDFNFDEYNCGVRFNLNINGKPYEVEKTYK